MKYLFAIVGLWILMCPLIAQNYPQIVSLESRSGINAVLVSMGEGSSRKEAKENALESLFYTLFFQGVDGVNENQALVCNEKEQYTNPFFNAQKRYRGYVIEEEETASNKVGGIYQVTVRATIRLKQLVNDVKKNTCVKKTEGPQQIPSILVVPFTKTGESFKAIMENDFDMSIAIATIRDGFVSRKVKTYDLLTLLERGERMNQYAENAGAAESNDRTLLESSGADVYVKVRLNRVEQGGKTRVSLIMDALNLATDAVIASKTHTPRLASSVSVDYLTKSAVQNDLDAFLNDICREWDGPGSGSESVSLHITLLDGGNIQSFNDRVGSNNMQLFRVISRWVKSHCKSYNDRGMNGELLMYDKIVMPDKTEDGMDMDVIEYASMLTDYLDTLQVGSTFVIEGNKIIFTVN